MDILHFKQFSEAFSGLKKWQPATEKSSMKVSINDLFLLACGTYFWLEMPLLHLLCCPAAVMMLTAAIRSHDLTEPNLQFSSGGGPLT